MLCQGRPESSGEKVDFNLGLHLAEPAWLREKRLSAVYLVSLISPVGSKLTRPVRISSVSVTLYPTGLNIAAMHYSVVCIVVL